MLAETGKNIHSDNKVGIMKTDSFHDANFDVTVERDVDVTQNDTAVGHTSKSWWRHQMETFSALLALCAGNSPVISEFPSQRPVIRSFDVFFDLCLNNGWVNNHEPGDLRHHHAHYDVTAMKSPI